MNAFIRVSALSSESRAARLANWASALTSGQRQKVFTIYAWNEFGEDGMVAPTRGEGYLKLEAIADVFGRGRQ